MSRCPWCAEKYSGKPAACPACGRLLTNEQGDPIRPIDVIYDDLVRHQHATASHLMLWGSLGFGLASLAVPLLNIAAPIAAGMLLVTQMVVLRIVLARRPMQFLGARRRLYVRWITRLGLIVVGTFGYGATLAPIAGAIAGSATFAALTFATHRYILRSLEREKNRRAPELWEKIVLTLLVLVLGMMITVAIAIGAALGWFATMLGDFG